MSALNTSIRGAQIQNGAVDTLQLAANAVTTAKITDKNVTMAKIEDGADKQVMIAGAAGVPAYQTVSGDVVIGNTGVVTIQANAVEDSMVNDNVATGLAGAGLAASAGVMALDVNELGAAAVDVAADSIAIVDATDNSSKKESIADFATAMAGTGITATNGVLAADAVANNIVEGDISVENESANCNGSTTAFTLSATPLASSLDVYLNGLRLEEGSGKDFTWSATTVTFATAPATGDILIIRYIIDN